MELLRRMSTRADPIDEEQLRQLSQQRRKSSFAVSSVDEGPILPAAIKPTIEIFPSSTSKRQQTLLISPDAVAKGFVITSASTGKHLLTVSSPSVSIPTPSHTKHFYGDLRNRLQAQRTERQGSDSSTSSDDGIPKKICTLTRDSLSFRKRHHVDDPYNGRRLLEIEFTSSTWEEGQLKAAVSVLNGYSQAGPLEPVRLKWKGRSRTLEGVLEWNGKPVAVCAAGLETEEGEYALYVAPGMDVYLASIIVMAVDDRTRRGSNESSRNNSYQGKNGYDVIQ